MAFDTSTTCRGHACLPKRNFFRQRLPSPVSITPSATPLFLHFQVWESGTGEIVPEEMNRKDSGETPAAGKFAGGRKPPPKLAAGNRKFRRTQPLDRQRPEASPYTQKLENQVEPVETNKPTAGEGAAGGSQRPKVHRTSGNPLMTTQGTRTSPASS
ncbi:hypothetical protein Cgig2_015793 [Carnegiea gigantea]|uniref:Uncharacterized protein n=1 Tax=Carnegiea gigantea TaxID=171969 RepID=A0A9Q1KIF4_9CARY|nr:hypothetical protein Cgig2_015793 [Carnegiea gigantea]